MLRTFLTIAATAFVVIACTSSSSGGQSDEPSAAPSSGSAGEPPPSAPASSGDVQLPPAITDPIVADAAGRLAVEPSAVTIVSAHEESWNDGSLGCPEPGMMYTQALVDGYQVVVEANGTQLDYRGTGPGQFRICERP